MTPLISGLAKRRDFIRRIDLAITILLSIFQECSREPYRLFQESCGIHRDRLNLPRAMRFCREFLKPRKKCILKAQTFNMLRKIEKNSQKSFEKPKGPNWRARCPLACPWRAKKGDDFLTSFLMQNIKKMNGNPLETLKNFQNKNFEVSVPKNVKGGPLGFLNIHSVAKFHNN